MNQRIFVKYAIVIGWMLLIFVFSSQGHEVSSGQSQGVMHFVSHTLHVNLPEMIVRKGAHIFLYFVLGILVCNLLSAYRWRLGVSVLVVMMYACTDEIHQLFVPGRTGMATDVLIDTTAGLVGAGIFLLCMHSICLQKKR